MYNHNKAQQSKNRVHISWDILYVYKVFEKATSDQSYNHKRNEMYNQVIEWMECYLFLGVVLD